MRKQLKPAAFLLLLIHAVSVFYPGVSYALTSGPTAPEASQFQQTSITNLVDPSTGDFSYSIPLIDVDGYPINIAYSSGGGMDDEAGWTGFGWNINSGALTRVMKGLPDDFNGTDKIEKDYNIRPDITGGIAFNVSLEIFGLDFLGANASMDVFYNNQRGLGVEIGAGISATLSTAKHVSGEYTAGLSAGANLGITSNSQTGADFNFGANMGISLKDKENASGSLGLRFGGSLNSRAGMKSTTLGASFNTSKSESDDHASKRKEEATKAKKEFKPAGSSSGSTSLGSATSNYGMAFNPTITMPMKNQSYSLSPQIGVELWGLQIPVQATAHYAKQQLAFNHKSSPAYGFLHMNKGRSDKDAVLDFNREKDVPYMESTPTLSVPYVTPDLFTATSQFGTSQFKPFSNSSGVLFDSYSENTSDALSLGIEFGAGGGIKGGGDFSYNGSSTVTKKWNANNDYLNFGDFTDATQVDGEDVYFKLVGEKSSINNTFFSKIAGTDPVKVKTANVDDQAKALSVLENRTHSYPVVSKIERAKREPRGEFFRALLAGDAQTFALDRSIKSFTPLGINSTINQNNGNYGNYTFIGRTDSKRRDHHLSEITVTKNDGMRLVYGIPVYNNEQTDVTFNTDQFPADPSNNFVNYTGGENSISNHAGIDYYYSKETTPAYATSFLISGVCSPDFVDITGNGISDDDIGTAVKFNYSRVNDHYQWRSPNAASGSNYANFSQGNKSITEDNKASFSYGSKELWFPYSVESKTMVAVFRLGDRDDAYGYNPDGSIDNNSKQKKLEQIDLYTKQELLTNPGNPVPVKTVHFEYDYSLYRGVPNNIRGEGKLTLKSVYFTYAGSRSGEENRYFFNYNSNDGFEYQQYDRWGTYKPALANGIVANLDNNDFPYTLQDKIMQDQYVSKWQLSEISLPSGGKIRVEYESDDYAYVQNQRANQMAKIVGFTLDAGVPVFNDYERSDKIYIQLPSAPANRDEGAWQYFDNINQLYFKCMVDLDNKNHKELVSGYAKVTGVDFLRDGAGNPTDIAAITVEKRGAYHPVAAASWQFLRSNLPKYAYPYSVSDGLGPLAFVKALLGAIRSVAELVTPFEEQAMRQNFAKHVDDDKCFARIGTGFKKLGGGLRVSKLMMLDSWESMSQGTGFTSTSGMKFDYTKQVASPYSENHFEMSTGVATYEPMAGSEENPFKQPITYQQKAHLTSSIYTVEEPLGESYFPAPSVVYSQVTIKNLDATGEIVGNGYTVKKFYTAKDFPTKVKRTDLSKSKYNQRSIFGIFNIDNGNSVVLSQGFYVENNDMSGKPLSDETFDGTNKMLSGSYFHYKSSGTEQLELDNTALTLQPDGSIKTENVGIEYEMYTDMREQVTENVGVNLNLNLDVLMFAFITIPFPTVIPIVQSTHSGYEAASTIKVVNRYAIADKVTTIDNGSTVTNENMMWDPLTGEVLLTKTRNGFDDPIYSFKLPAYMVGAYEKGMGAAYHNTGLVFKDVPISNGVISNPSILNFVVPGDEFGVVAEGNRIWAMELDDNRGIRMITKDGSLYNGTTTLILLRSGRRNLIVTEGYNVVSLKSPIISSKIDIDASTEIVNTNANIFADEWTAEPMAIPCKDTVIYSRNNNPNRKNITELVKKATVLFETETTNRLPHTYNSPNCGDKCSDLSSYLFTEYTNSPYCWGTNTKMVNIKYRCNPLDFEYGNAVYFDLSYKCGDQYVPFGIVLTPYAWSGGYIQASACFEDPCPGEQGEFFLEQMTCGKHCCPELIDHKINPYTIGLKGNWRAKDNYVYTVARDIKLDAYNSAQLPTNLRKGGVYNSFSSFYVLRNNIFVNSIIPTGGLFPAPDLRWQSTGSLTKVNNKGQDVENVNPLGKYNSAQFGFNNLLVTALSNNARNNEIAYDGFEDYNVNLQHLIGFDNGQCNMDGHFNFKRALSIYGDETYFHLTNKESHTGNYSIQLTPGTYITDMVTTNRRTTNSLADEDKYDFNTPGEMILKEGGILKGFEPKTAKKYVLSGWIKGNVAWSSEPDDPHKAKIFVQGYNVTTSSIASQALAVKAGPKEDGWTRVMTTFEIPEAPPGETMTITVKLYCGDETAYFDDIRIHPFDANLKSYAYDYRTSRLMADLDENNYATYYEYNDEGQLTRTKKETDKGIVTLNEIRNRVKSCRPLLLINDPAPVTVPATVNLTDAAITAGSESGLTFSYYFNEAATIGHPYPATIDGPAGTTTYYIKATNSLGCFTVKPVHVTINP